jgi:hypothetical protein
VKLRSLAQSFVITAAVGSAACGKEPETARPDPVRPTPSASASSSASPTGSVTLDVKANPPPPPLPTKKRKHAALDAGAGGGTWKTPKGPVPAWSDLVAKNPVDASGRTIFVRNDDVCYVEEPMKTPPKKPLPTGFRMVDSIPVDCPPEVDDPAWDECTYSILNAPKKMVPGGECYCFSVGGNPPPPPRAVTCPKK